MKIVSHIIPLATPNILAFRTWQCHNAEDEITVQIATLEFIQYDENFQVPDNFISIFLDDSKFEFKRIKAIPIDERGHYYDSLSISNYIYLGKKGDTISRYDDRLLSLDYGWEKSSEDPDYTDLEKALMKKGLIVETSNIPEQLTMDIGFSKKEDYYLFESKGYGNKNPTIGFYASEQFDEIYDKNGKIWSDYRFDNMKFSKRIIKRLTEITQCIPFHEIVVDLRSCGQYIAEHLPGYDLQEIIYHLKNSKTTFNFTVLPESTRKEL